MKPESVELERFMWLCPAAAQAGVVFAYAKALDDHGSMKRRSSTTSPAANSSASS